MKFIYISLMVLLCTNLKAQFAVFGTASLNGSRIELTQAVNSSTGGAYDLSNIVNLNHSFTMRFFVNLGSKDANGADGMSFIFRDANSPNLSTFGLSGGGLSYENLADPFIAIEFDTYTNGDRSDPTYDHVAIMTHTANHGAPSSNLAGPVSALPNVINIEDGIDHEIGVVWDASAHEMKVYLDCILRLTLIQDIVNTIFSGDSLVYYGAIASTGGLNNLQVVEFNPTINLLDTLTASCGDTSILVTFPNKPVSCSSVSLDGTEFRLQDSTAHRGTGFARKYMGVNGANPINCSSSGLTNSIRVYLDQPLLKGYYVLRIKKGNDLTTLGPFCHNTDLKDFQLNDIPEFAFMVVKVGGNVDLKIVDTNNSIILQPGITVCLPKLKPFPLLKGISNKGKYWSWLYNNDTIIGQNVDYVWATQEGNYKVVIKDEYNCTNSKNVNVIFDSIPEFFFRPPLYCDEFGKSAGMPAEISAPVFDPPWTGTWEWYVKGLGQIHTGDTLDSLKLVINQDYILKYIKPPKVIGGVSCTAEVEFTYDRSTFPPADPLFVAFTDSIISLCADLNDTVPLLFWKDGIRSTFAPLNYKWFINSTPISKKSDPIKVSIPGIYSLFVTDSLGCWGTDSVEVTHVLRSDSFAIFCDFASPGYYRFSWNGLNDATGYEISFNQGISWQNTMSNAYHEVKSSTAEISAMVRALVPNVCQYSYYASSQVCPETNIEIPNVITPNGDGLNEVFEIRGLSAFPNSSLMIIDRWGNIVYENNDYKNDWAGEDIPEGVYYYTLRLNDSEERSFKGHFSILR